LRKCHYDNASDDQRGSNGGNAYNMLEFDAAKRLWYVQILVQLGKKPQNSTTCQVEYQNPAMDSIPKL